MNATTPIDFGQPPPALVSTAQLAVAAGSGAERVALWTATNRSGELCVGWRAGPSTARPAAFICLRRGLEPPLVTVERGGGRGSVATWGAVVGLASPRVARATAETLYGSSQTVALRLRPLSGRPGWRTFTTGVVSHPTSQEVHAYGPGGSELERTDGGMTHPSGPPPGGAVVVTPPGTPPTGPAWSDTYGDIPASSGAIGIALADPAVRAILTASPGWIVREAGWFNCSNVEIGRVVEFSFASPASFEATLPMVGKPTGAFSYAETVRRVQATNWPAMAVSVDTAAGAVVAVRPLPNDVVPGALDFNETTLATVTPAHDAGPPDDPTCWQSG